MSINKHNIPVKENEDAPLSNIGMFCLPDMIFLSPTHPRLIGRAMISQ